MKISKEDELKIIDAYINSGLSGLEICRKFGHRPKVLYRLIKQYNLTRKVPYKQVSWMKGSNLKKYWKSKYSEDEVNYKYKQMIEKNRAKSSGKNNPMYGKPSPNGSGNGWKGWYHGFYFRSLRELSFMIRMDEEGKEFQSAEAFSIPYSFLNTERTYRPDFIVDNNILIEIKPKKLHSSPNIIAKTNAARKFCSENGYEYQLIDEPIHYTACVDFDVEWHGEKYKNKIINWIYKEKPNTESMCNLVKFLHKGVKFSW